MPVYEYKCSSGHQYEKTEGFDAPSTQTCGDCGATARRMISLPAVIFKGSGFYHTDNRKESSRNGRFSTASDSADSSASSDGHGHSHESAGGHSHASDSSSKVEAAAAD